MLKNIGRDMYEVNGLDGGYYLVQRRTPETRTYHGWQTLVRNGPSWVETRYSGETLDQVVAQLRAAGIIR
jgi:hypothetical protein